VSSNLTPTAVITFYRRQSTGSVRYSKDMILKSKGGWILLVAYDAVVAYCLFEFFTVTDHWPYIFIPIMPWFKIYQALNVSSTFLSIFLLVLGYLLNAVLAFLIGWILEASFIGWILEKLLRKLRHLTTHKPRVN
jgi:hypothetical protein